MVSPGPNVLSAVSLSTFMVTSLPKVASPQLRNSYDAIALGSHAGMLAVGFRLIGLGEDHKIESHSSSDEPQPLPAEWNNGSPGAYAFRYKHYQSSMEFLLKVQRLGTKAMVMGLGVGDDKTAHFELSIRDYVSESSLPASPAIEGRSVVDARKAITDIFISTGRLFSLVRRLRRNDDQSCSAIKRSTTGAIFSRHLRPLKMP